MNAKETKIQKARNLRYRRPIVKELNIAKIREDLWEIQAACDDVRWNDEFEDESDSLLNALNGDEDEAYEFKMAFADLCADCEKMQADLGRDEWIPECFDIFFVAAEAGDSYGGLLGWDSYEGDYYGIDFKESFAEKKKKKKLMRMTKDELIVAARQCFKIYHAYIGLRNRYDNMKAAIDILRDRNAGFLQTVRDIERLYEDICGDLREQKNAWKKWMEYTNTLPPEAWIY